MLTTSHFLPRGLYVLVGHRNKSIFGRDKAPLQKSFAICTKRQVSQILPGIQGFYHSLTPGSLKIFATKSRLCDLVRVWSWCVGGFDLVRP